ncbi:hypothetical protein RJ45_21935 [Photobacterium gaetbulicola]|uniref:Glycosyltransferase 2-like domain-containing protein n=1 Tax=Photobacterium gaetbulicola TaxID=1295392 RepID=A0A0B9GY57_9GAMM|nr:glycosyltransferase family 2 protein [Photobacterium gaetbulicola]KHT61577.1 hypothetical protein RJ45_21935 [Photobacterium gaetbulicola]
MKGLTKQFENVYIVLLNYNGAEDTISCIESLASTGLKNLNIVIVDNKSTDNSVERIECYLKSNSTIDNQKSYYNVDSNRISLILSDCNGGYGYGNNLGIKYALSQKADYIVVLNNDVVVASDFISPLISESKLDARVGILSPKILFHPEVNKVWFAGGSYSLITGRAKHLFFGSDVGNTDFTNIESTFNSGCCWLIPAHVFDKVGLINDDYFMYVEDVEFCHRVQMAGFTLKVVPDSTIYHKVGASTGRDSDFSIYWTSRNTIRFLLENTKKYQCFFSIPYYIAFISFLYLKRKQISSLIPHFKGVYSGLTYMFNR